MKKVWQFILDRVWQFPQAFLGRICIKACAAEKRRILTKDGWLITWHFFNKNRNRFTRLISGVSLGGVILLPYMHEATIKHEYGHSRQSLYLGLFYLPVIGIYSAVFCNIWDRLFHKKWNRYDRHYWYYKTRWTERWADLLGGVDRDKELAKIPRPADSKYPEAIYEK